MKRLFIFLFIAGALNSCNLNTGTDSDKPAGDTTVPVKQEIKTITKLIDQKDTVSTFIAPDGKSYTVTLLADLSEYDNERSLKSAVGMNCDNDNFQGTDRKAAKLSIVKAKAKTYQSLSEFISSLKSDSIMTKNPNIKRDETNKRVTEENRNVVVKNVLIYAIKRESDNDYHIIAGDNNRLFFNVEIAGLPANNHVDYNKLLTARNQFKAHFGNVCNVDYHKFDPPVPVEIEGSLFFDIDHKAGVVGPSGYRPKTAWEIHPVTKITFK
jgi:hypothetical protein